MQLFRHYRPCHNLYTIVIHPRRINSPMWRKITFNRRLLVRIIMRIKMADCSWISWASKYLEFLDVLVHGLRRDFMQNNPVLIELKSSRTLENRENERPAVFWEYNGHWILFSPWKDEWRPFRQSNIVNVALGLLCLNEMSWTSLYCNQPACRHFNTLFKLFNFNNFFLYMFMLKNTLILPYNLKCHQHIVTWNGVIYRW